MTVKEYIEKMFWGFYSLSPSDLFEFATDLKHEIDRVANGQDPNEIDVCHSLLNIMDVTLNDNWSTDGKKAVKKEGIA